MRDIDTSHTTEENQTTDTRVVLLVLGFLSMCFLVGSAEDGSKRSEEFHVAGFSAGLLGEQPSVVDFGPKSFGTWSCDEYGFGVAGRKV